MTRKKMLIDTSAWVEYLGNSHSEMGDQVTEAIINDQAVTCGVVMAELLQGVSNKEAQGILDFLFSQIEMLPMDESVMLDAGKKLQNLSRQEIEIPFNTAVIAALVEKYQVSIISSDKNLTVFKF